MPGRTTEVQKTLQQAGRCACLLAMILTSLFGAGCDRDRVHQPYGQRPAAVGRGEVLFAANCSRCHGQSGQGGRMTRPLQKRELFTFGKDRDDLIRTVSDGTPTGMPAFADILSTQDRADLAAYILWLQ